MTDSKLSAVQGELQRDLRLDHELWNLSACGRHGTRERGEDENVWDASCEVCLKLRRRIDAAYKLGAASVPQPPQFAAEQQSHDAEIYRIADALAIPPKTATIEDIVKAIKVLREAVEGTQPKEKS